MDGELAHRLHFGITGQTGVLDWFTLLVGATAAVTLTLHGALWVAFKTEGDLQMRARSLAGRAWIGVGALIVVLSLAMHWAQPLLRENMAERPWGAVFPLTALTGFVLVRRFLRRGDDLRAFLASCTFIVGMMASAVFAIFPYLLPSNGDPALGLTAVYTKFGGKVATDDAGH